MSKTALPADVENSNVNATIHRFGVMQDSSSEAASKFTEREPLITPPPTVWTKFNAKHRFGKWILLGCGTFGIFVIMFIVIGSLGVFKNQRYRNEAGISIGTSKYPGTSSGDWASGNMSGSGDGTYYDPGVGLTACGNQFTAQDYIVAMNEYDFGYTDNSNTSPTCGTCIIVTGPNGSQQAHVWDICPKAGCGRGSVDLTPAVFAKIGDLTAGRIPVSWKQC